MVQKALNDVQFSRNQKKICKYLIFIFMAYIFVKEKVKAFSNEILMGNAMPKK